MRKFKRIRVGARRLARDLRSNASGRRSRRGAQRGAGRLALAALLALVVAAPFRGQERGVYTVGGRTIVLELASDRLGVVLREGALPGELASAGIGEALPLERLHGLVDVLDPPGKPDGTALLALVHALLRAKGVAHAGTLVTAEGAREPMLLTTRLIVAFDPAATGGEVEVVLERHGLELVRASRFGGPHLVAVREASGVDALAACRALADEPLVRYAEPNFVHGIERTAQTAGLNDPLLLWQWHHRNIGQASGTRDADIDTVEAWQITRGSADVVIAVIEDGFDTAHPDLVPNLWKDPASGAPGFDFSDWDTDLAGAAGDPESAAHGTAVAGCAAARGDNGIGVAGSCPECSLMLIRGGADDYGDVEALRYAAAHADVIVNSWTYPLGTPVPHSVQEALIDAATAGRDGLGCVILFAVRNEEIDVGAIKDIAALAEVVAIGSVSNTDERTTSCGYGACLSVLGPSRLNRAPNATEGTLNVTSTDWRGAPHGYNADPALAVPMDEGWMPCAELPSPDYTACFGGTSAATPIVAGVVGLVLALAPELEREQVKRLLQDTADRVQDSYAAYSAVDGRGTTLRHGSGRVNALEALRVVAPAASGGSDGVDLVLRDNRLDWGNTEQPSSTTFEAVRGTIGHWRSPDIRVDAPPFAPVPADALAFEELAHEDPLVGVANRVYVRVRNRGPVTADDVVVELLWARGGPTLPPFPDDFWDAFPHAPGVLGAWTSLGTRGVAALPYCGASVAGLPGDAAAVLAFELDLGGVVLDPLAAPAVGLVAIATCRADGPSDASRATTAVDDIVATDNDVTQRCARLATDPAAAPGPWTVVVRNPYAYPIECRLELLAPSCTFVRSVPADASAAATPDPAPGAALATNVLGELFALAAGEERTLRLTPIDPGPAGPVELRQWNDIGGFRTLMGGLVLVR